MPNSNYIIATTRELDQLGTTNQSWLADYEDFQLDVGCDHEVLTRLLETAPTDFSRGVVAGRLISLAQIAQLTGRHCSRQQTVTA